jgi:hypothetical protein
MSDYPRFVEGGVMTTVGSQLVEWVEAQYLQFDKPGADANIAALNSMPGPIQEYYTIVHKMHVVTPTKWLEGFTQSARNAYDIMKYVEAEAAKEQQVQETAAKTDDLEAKFARFQESVAEQVAKLEGENAALRDELAALKSAKAETPVAEVTAEVESVADEPVKTSKKAKKTAEAEPTDEKPAGETPAESE